MFGLARDDERVAVRAECGDHDLGDANARLRGHERGEGLVLDLLERARTASASRRVPVREEAAIAARAVACPARHDLERAP